MLNIEVNNDVVQVQSDYDEGFISGARSLGGKWNGANKSWDFNKMTQCVLIPQLQIIRLSGGIQYLDGL